MSDRRALRIPEVAAALGVHPETVRRAIVRGELPARRLGNAWLVPVEGLERWLHSDHGETQDDGRGQHLPAGDDAERPEAGPLDRPR